MENTISEVTRRNICDYFTANDIPWSGRLSEPDFLSRLFDLSKLPSHDYRYKSAMGDINMHRINFHDWEDDWVYTDNRFAILWTSDTEYLRFICETVHPIVRPNPKEAWEIVNQINTYLHNDGWELFQEKELSGRPIFGARELGKRAVIFTEPTGWKKVDRQIQEISSNLQEATTEEQFQVIGLLSREALITLAQIIFDPEKHIIIDNVSPSKTDASRMLEAYFSTELSGSANEESRAHAKAALKLANALQHMRTADYKLAALCAEATASVINLTAILSGRRR